MIGIATSRLTTRLRLLSGLYLCLCLVESSQHSSTTASARKPPEPSSDPAPPRATGDDGLDSRDHRVILHPGRWKIRTRETPRKYVAYRFVKWIDLFSVKFKHDTCSDIACFGLPDRQQGCDEICSSETMRALNETSMISRRNYIGAAVRVDAAFDDLTALKNTHIANWDRGVDYGSMIQVDVLQRHRDVLTAALHNISLHHAALGRSLTTRLSTRLSPGDLDVLLDTWKSATFELASLLNTAAIVLERLHQQLLTCTRSIQREDMTGCEPEFVTEFYTDIPVAGRIFSPNGLLIIAERQRWSPTVLSQWYLPFIDSSNGNRTCWLDRPMLSDDNANYRVPRCDWRGLCEPLERDNNTVSACDVDEYGEISLRCPVVCGSPCFGPICYRPQSNTYTPRMAFGGTRDIDTKNDLSLIRVAKSPRVLSKVYSLSDMDIHASLADIQNDSSRASELMRRGQVLLRNFEDVALTAQNYIDKAQSETAQERSRESACIKYGRIVDQNWIMACVSIALSVVTFPLLIVIIIKMKIKQ